MNYLITILLTFVTGTAFACSEDGKTGFLPENDLFIPVGLKTAGGLTESQFNAVIDKIETIYSPIMAEMGGKLIINRRWDDGTVNASALRIGGWVVNMYGGLARHETITEDGFALVLCHEIGHHLGGAPKVSGLPTPDAWPSNEGQSDYFATLKCLRKTFLNDDNIGIVKKSSHTISLALLDACVKAWSEDEDLAICIRSGMAGISVARLFAALRNQPEAKFETPHTKVVTKVDDSHPSHQCRLDTFLQGSLCEVGFNEDLSQKDEVQGTCHGSLGHTKGLRPLCWFKPKM